MGLSSFEIDGGRQHLKIPVLRFVSRSGAAIQLPNSTPAFEPWLRTAFRRLLVSGSPSVTAYER